MKKLILIAFLICKTAAAQHSLTGTVISLKDSSVIAGVSLSAGQAKAITDEKGRFVMGPLTTGSHQLICKSFLFETIRIPLFISTDTTITIMVYPYDFAIEEHMISTTRALPETPVAYSELDKEEIGQINFGTDIPALLNSQPSVVSTSDAGNAIGYSSLRIRGTDASRINVTVNGIPFNDAESHQVYWVDLPDIASSVENIQIQRGVGSSTNGAASFGGSINVKTTSLSNEPYLHTSHAAGSFNTMKNSLSFGTGLLNKKWFFDGRLSRIASDGYVDRASSDLKSFFISTGFSRKNSLLRATVFSGREITYQSWNGVPESRINNDVEGMQQYILRNFSEEEEAANLLNSGRTYNYYTYNDQVDHYTQDHYQLHYSLQTGRNTLFSAALHYTYGRGYYEEFKYATDIYGAGSLSSYGLEPVITGNDTITESDLVRRKWLDNDFYGITAALNYEIDNRQTLILGGAWNRYDGRHFHRLTWMQFAGNTPPDYRYYADTAHKNDGNIYAKYTVTLGNNAGLYIDQQIRNVMYEFNGLADSESNLIRQSVNHTFYNPKAGIFFNKDHHRAYISAAVAHKEPNRSDFKESTAQSRPSPEMLIDYEAGWQYSAKYIYGGINLYYMDYKDQLVLTGAVNDVGNYTRTNVPSSYRAGIELNAEAKFNRFYAGGNLTFSRNKIKKFTEYITNYDDNTELSFDYKNTDIAFSPSVITAAYAGMNFFRSFHARISGKHVGKQYLDNTQSETRKIDAYTVLDVLLSCSLQPDWLKEIEFSLMLNNVLDKEYISNGYTFGYYYGEMVRENMYYPQAGFNLMGRITVKL